MGDINSLPPRIKNTLNLLQNLTVSSSKFLDIGCGTGDFSVLFKEALKADEGFGIEINPITAVEANEKGICTITSCVDTDDIPFKNESFDVVFALEIIEHLNNPNAFLKEIHRVLKPQGFLILSTPNIASWHSRIHLAMGYQPYPISVSRDYPSSGQFLRFGKSKKGIGCLCVSGRGDSGHIRFLHYVL